MDNLSKVKDDVFKELIAENERLKQEIDALKVELEIKTIDEENKKDIINNLLVSNRNYEKELKILIEETTQIKSELNSSFYELKKLKQEYIAKVEGMLDSLW